MTKNNLTLCAFLLAVSCRLNKIIKAVFLPPSVAEKKHF